ncbi:retrovirus-related pol polyprotein from transposon TNT 1-94 [Tanacetum coccineum]
MNMRPQPYQQQQPEFSQPNSSLVVPVSRTGDNPIDAIIYMMGDKLLMLLEQRENTTACASEQQRGKQRTVNGTIAKGWSICQAVYKAKEEKKMKHGIPRLPDIQPLRHPTPNMLLIKPMIWMHDSDCDELNSAKNALMANLPRNAQMHSLRYVQIVLSQYGNDQFAKIMGYGDYQIGNDSQGANLYYNSDLGYMASSPICLLSKASKTKSWLWHRRLSHLNFGSINHLARHGLVRGLPKLKFEKDHLCSACALGKSSKKPHKPKSEDTNQEKLYLLHMDLCGPMRVASVNGKKYILVIVDDYSRFTWVKCLRSKDEAPAFIINFLKMIQVRLKETVRRIRTDNGTEFVNQTLREYYEKLHPDNEHAVSTGSPSSTTVDQDAPSQSHSPTTQETQTPILSHDVEEDNHDIEVQHMATLVPPDHQVSEHNSKWTKDHPLENIIGASRQTSFQHDYKLHEQALFCYFEAFLTASVKPQELIKKALNSSMLELKLCKRNFHDLNV